MQSSPEIILSKNIGRLSSLSWSLSDRCADNNRRTMLPFAASWRLSERFGRWIITRDEAFDWGALHSES